ncbi:protein TolQ [Hirschia baltica]|uniref:Protein TolQ n=1 Tax=Hirschia baltica (strain ATCC 49814 / DSM 5838 / IFAM 1418) TaxID=582402 RepID=C6XNC9_HIRBI|nr:protein TolQ [Hirschia baltica]ACT60073.1 protein TolQ [Hirschia baltica ATCC 49814]
MMSLELLITSGIDNLAALPMMQAAAVEVTGSEPAEIAAHSDFSFLALILAAGPVVKVVMLVLVIMSIWSWMVTFDKWTGMGAARKKGRQFEEAFWSGQPLDEMDDRVGDKPSDALARVYSAGSREWREARRLRTLTDTVATSLLQRARSQMNVAVNREAARLEKGLSTLAIISSSAPFIGLFGTVWGIMTAFRDIGMAGETNLAVVAPGMAEALFATALGLLAAIPAMMFYNKFSGEVNKFVEHMDTFAEEFTVRISRRLAERLDE